VKHKILFVIERLGAGGAEKALSNLLNSMDYDKYEIDLQLFSNSGINLQHLPQNISILPPLFEMSGKNDIEQALFYLKKGELLFLARKTLFLAFARIRYRKNARVIAYFNWKASRAIVKEKNDKQYDIAVAYMHGAPTYYVRDCVLAGRKICWVHNDYAAMQKVPQEREYFEDFDAVATISETCVRSLQQYFPKLNNVMLVRNMNCPEKIRELSQAFYPDEFEDCDDTILILSIGRCTHQKGFDMAIESAAKLKTKGVPFKWFVIGDGEFLEKYRNDAELCGVSDVIRFLGLRTNPYPYMLHANIYAQTSRFEGKSIAIDEAKILCKPILCTAFRSVEDQLNNWENALIVPISTEGISDGLTTLCEYASLRERLTRYLEAHQEDQIEILQENLNVFTPNSVDDRGTI